jgi:two-component system phosphate regulon sensor histidine kinase PhoR
MNKTWIEIQPIVESLTENYIANTCKPFHLSFDLKANTVYADNEYLAEVISNLIDNSIKYSKDSVDILIRSEALEGFTRISVLDNGLGISKKDQAIIFNKYERGAAIHRNKEGGATGFGLGLNFVKQVVDAHDGKITVRSKEGEYTEFVILLPNR